MPVNSVQKLDTLRQSLNALTEKINSLIAKKKSLEKQISELEEKEFMTIIKANNCTVSTLNEDLKIIKLLKENNLTEQDIIVIVINSFSSNSLICFSRDFFFAINELIFSVSAFRLCLSVSSLLNAVYRHFISSFNLCPNGA